MEGTTTPAAPAPALPKVGQKFSLSRLERLDTAKTFATIALERAKLDDAYTRYLDQMGRTVLKRCGFELAQAGRIFMRYDVVDGALQAIEVIPEPTPTDAAPTSPAPGPDASAPAAVVSPREAIAAAATPTPAPAPAQA